MMMKVNRRNLLGQSLRLALTTSLVGYAATPALANIQTLDSSPRSLLLAALNDLPDGVQLRNVDDVLRFIEVANSHHCGISTSDPAIPHRQ